MSNVPNHNKVITKDQGLTGAEILALSLKNLGVEVIFGIVGIPVVEVAEACIQEGIRFIGCRNEQTASYAAGAYGFLNNRPGVCLVVSGPGVIHALSGLFNAQANCWPLMLIGGSCETQQSGMGAFQELDQVNACKPYTKYSAKPSTLNQIPSVADRAYHTCLTGKPGATYLDLPADMIRASININTNLVYPKFYSIPKGCANEEAIQQAIQLIVNTEKFLIVVGKGAAYSRCEKELLELITKLNAPFLPSPMGKGVVPDSHPNCISSARSYAIKNAEVVLILGARLNWMFQFGRNFRKNAKIIQVDLNPDELVKTRKPDISLIGDIKSILNQINQNISKPNNNNNNNFLKSLKSISKSNQNKIQPYFEGPKEPMNHHLAIRAIQKVISEINLNYTLISEGARTMDVTRVLVHSNQPRKRLDAGTLGVMGVGVGYAIAAQLTYPNEPVIAIMGDSAFGFSAMDIETCIRYDLPIIFIIINNSGIYSGLPDLSDIQKDKIPSFALSPKTQYDCMAHLVEGKAYGVTVTKEDEVSREVKKALEMKKLTVINVLIDTRPADEGLYWQVNDPSPKL